MCVCTTAMACCVYIYIMKKWIPLCFILSLHLFLLLLSLLSLIIHSSCYFQFCSHASRLALLDFIFLCMFSYYDCHYAQIEQGELLILISVLLLLRHFLCHIHALSLSLLSHMSFLILQECYSSFSCLLIQRLWYCYSPCNIQHCGAKKRFIVVARLQRDQKHL